MGKAMAVIEPAVHVGHAVIVDNNCKHQAKEMVPIPFSSLIGKKTSNAHKISHGIGIDEHKSS